jgi:hypothetical protein
VTLTVGLFRSRGDDALCFDPLIGLVVHAAYGRGYTSLTRSLPYSLYRLPVAYHRMTVPCVLRWTPIFVRICLALIFSEVHGLVDSL